MALPAVEPKAMDFEAQVVDTVSTIFSAAGAEDIAKFDSVIAPDFYIFANGTRFNGDAIMGAIKAQHAAGKRFDEHVTEADIHISDNIAWIAYVNRGSITCRPPSSRINQFQRTLPAGVSQRFHKGQRRLSF
jgi:hypothetical protein